MPDWKELVRQRLATLNLPPGAKEEVVLELAAHLEDSVSAAQEGSEAADPELAQLQWRKLLRAIERTKCEEGKMNQRTKSLWLPSIGVLFTVGLILLFLGRAQFWQGVIWAACMALLLCTVASEANHLNLRTKSLWLPAMATILGASLAMTALQRVGGRPSLIWAGPVAMLFYWPWLAILPFFGGLGAYLSRRAGGAVRSRISAALAPALWLLGMGLLFEPVEFANSGFSHLRYFGYGMANWVAIPGIALLFGALPFLSQHVNEPGSLKTEV